LPDNDADFPTRWRLIKSTFSHALPRTERISISRRKKGERGIWQRRYWEHFIKDDKDFERQVDYIHYNPVKQVLFNHLLIGLIQAYTVILNKE
jgi:putative transposase